MWIEQDMMNLLSDLNHEEEFLEESVLLGCSNDFTQLFAIDLGNSDKAVLEKKLGGVFVKMQQSFFMLGGHDVALLSKGYALLKWHFNNRYSGTSGQLTKKDVSGSKRTCLTTGSILYPQMSPAVITQVSNGTLCLLARKAIFPPGLYTALAGFCEIGETVEAAVHREVAEEVGLKVVSVRYSGSQHWPFPSGSLMIGCQAKVHSSNTKLSLDETELEAACWFGKEEVRAALQAAVSAENIGGNNDRLCVPPPWTIAHKLIQEWLHEE
uniref:NAD(P)H pyrophosphatase NUDT13, mitochondrial isoform X3 n=1 Tax=Myxine glutinosa TaxID=7769 RepID=UPI00358F09F8